MEQVTAGQERAEKVRTARYALLLFFVAPLVGEFLLGNLPITWLFALLVIAPLYGGGAILIRETACRFRLGWKGVLLLGIAYAVLEEAWVTQSLFNPNYVGARLLDYGFIPALGIGVWWTLFVISIHVIWSIATPIALVQAVSGPHSRRPWLAKTGLTITSILFILGCIASAGTSMRADPFWASGQQFLFSGAAALVVAALAFAVGRRRRRTPTAQTPFRRAPGHTTVGVWALMVGSVFLVVSYFAPAIAPAALTIPLMLLIVALGLVLLHRWSAAADWSARHELAFAMGLLMTYGWFGFVHVPPVGDVSPLIDTAGNAVFLLAATALAAIALRRIGDTDWGSPCSVPT